MARRGRQDYPSAGHRLLNRGLVTKLGPKAISINLPPQRHLQEAPIRVPALETDR